MGRVRIGRYRAVYLSPFVVTVGRARTVMSELLPVDVLKDPIEFEPGDEPETRVTFLCTGSWRRMRSQVAQAPPAR